MVSSSSSIHIANTIITVQNLNHATSKSSQSVWSYIGHDGATTDCVVGFLGNRHSVLWRLKMRDFWFSVIVCHLLLITLLSIFFFFLARRRGGKYITWNSHTQMGGPGLEPGALHHRYPA